MSVTCIECGKKTLEEDEVGVFICHNCGKEYVLEFT